MKYKHIFKALLLCSVLFLTNCSSDDDTMVATDVSSILDKWYYDSNGIIADIYFNSNGTHEQRIEILGNTLISSGEWSWLDESAGLMKIDNLSGQAQVANELWFRFTNTTEISFTLAQSTDGENFSSDFSYQDTDPNG